jgi:quercetin dioxygenase-like cupin family protein
MKLSNIKDMTRGWFIGDFEPSILRTKDFEVGLLTHKKGEVWPKHYHALSTEYNVLIEGSMTVQGTQINPGDIFIFEPMEIADPVFHEDCKVLCVKVPSVIGDKHEPI